jgi:hypothetical protein
MENYQNLSWDDTRALKDECFQLIKMHSIESEKSRIESEKSRIESEKSRIELKKSRIESEKSRIESEKSRIESEKSRIELEKFRIESEKSRIASEKRLKNMEDRMGAWSNSHGSFAEEYFYNSFENGQQDFFGETFNEITKSLKPKNKNLMDEYDIVMFNGSSAAIIEVKYKAHKNDISRVLKKAETFKILCPDYKDFKIYLGLASMSFYPELEQECLKQGIAIIKQIGDTVIINDEHLKVF